MSDKRIYGASGGNSGSSSEIDGPDDGGSESHLGAVGQDTKYEDEEPEKGCGGAAGKSGRALAASGGSGLYEVLGATPKARGRGDRGGPSRGKGDIWSNPTRRSARSLKGRGQAVAAAREYPPVREQKENIVVAVRVSGAGPRVYRGPGCDSHKAKKKTGSSGVIMFDSLRDSLLAALLGMSLFTLFVYDLLILERSDECGKVTGLTRTQLACTVTGAFMGSFFMLAVFASLLSSRNRKKSQQEDE
ncbi:hypothetical protein [Candidatus Ichthyocystis sparus]|uniref:hypothetical protein n=2 Tax=Candidatus Ichthyocystis sparus TaxID=1561004 RepID=UPI000B81952E|nr:hypothetical protein [Candidatus Ichthyocystis sparus]